MSVGLDVASCVVGVKIDDVGLFGHTISLSCR